MIKFKKISTINADQESSWTNKIFLTFDIDWAHDEILSDTINLVEKANCEATWFITHKTSIINRLYENTQFEMGIHPNFNFLLDGNICNGVNAKEVIERVKSIVPDAQSVRSHAMTQSSGLLELFKQVELTHDVNHFIPYHTEIKTKPWKLWNGLVRVPYNWEDDVHCMYGLEDNITKLITNPGLNVLDFHPIHVFLNTENIDRYENTRSLHNNPKELIKHRYQGYGTRNRLLELLTLSRN